MSARDSLPAAHVTLSTGHNSAILAIDTAFTALTGWPAREAVGQGLGILFGPWSSQAAVDRLLKAVERGEAAAGLQLKLYRHDGGTFDAWVALEATGEAQPVTCVIRNHAEAAAGPASAAPAWAPPAADRVLPVLLDALRDAVVMVDDRDVVLMANRAFLDLFEDMEASPVGQRLAALVELRDDQDVESDAVTAATILQADGRRRSASASSARGIDQRGQLFRVLTLRPAAMGAQPQVGPRLDTSAEIFERSVLKHVDEGTRRVAVGLIEIVADDELRADLGSIWAETLVRARAAAAAALAPELRPGEMFAVIEDDTLLLLVLDAATVDEALGRVHSIAQVVRQRLLREGGAVAALEAFGGAMPLDRAASAIAHPRPNPPGELARKLATYVRNNQDASHQVDSITADLIDTADVSPRPVRGRDLGLARFAIAEFDDRSRRWLAWAARRHRIERRRLDELDIALLGRVVERSFNAADFTSMIVPLRYDTLIRASTADRMQAIVRGLSQGARARLQAMVRDLPADLQGERLFAFVRRLAGFGRGVWLVLDGFDARGIQGRHEGLAGVAFDHGSLCRLIDRDPLAVKQFIERLRASNQPVLVSGVTDPAQATLLFNTFNVTLASGPGVERLVASRES